MYSKVFDKIGAVLGIVLLIVVVLFLSRHTYLITTILNRSGVWAPIVAVMIYPLLAPTPITTDPVTIIMGVTYGPLIGTIIAAIGNTLACVVEYYVGDKLSKGINYANEKKKMPLGLSKLSANSTLFLVLGRMIPGYGSKIISLLAGAEKVPIKKYVWTSIVTSLLGAAIMAYGGTGLVGLIK